MVIKKRRETKIYKCLEKINSVKLNLGCGNKIKKGYLNIDIKKTEKNVFVYDLRKYPWPWKNYSVDEIFMQHFFEHIDNLNIFFEELRRIGKKNCAVKIIVPYFSNPGSFSDPTHKRFITYTTFEYYEKIHNIKIKKIKLFFLTSKDFMKSKIISLPFDFLINLFPKVYQRFFPYIVPCSELHVEIKL